MSTATRPAPRARRITDAPRLLLGQPFEDRHDFTAIPGDQHLAARLEEHQPSVITHAPAPAASKTRVAGLNP